MLNGDILGFTPPLSITSAEMDEIVQCTLTALNSVADQLTKKIFMERLRTKSVLVEISNQAVLQNGAAFQSKK